MLPTWIKTKDSDGTVPSEFLVRGLKVGEMLELTIASGDKNVGAAAYVSVAKKCILDWKNIFDDDMNQVEFDKKLIDLLPVEVLSYLGDIIVRELSSVSDEEEHKLKGFIRWSMWASEDKNKKKVEEFNCKKCIEQKRWHSKLCGLTQDERDLRSGLDLDDEDDQDDEKVSHNAPQQSTSDTLDKFKAKRKNKQKYHYNIAEEKQTKAIDSDGFLLSQTKNFRFPECPTSWIPSWIRMTAEVMLYCEQKNLNYFSGGVEDQLYKLYTMGRIVSSEYNRIENERFEEKNK